MERNYKEFRPHLSPSAAEAFYYYHSPVTVIDQWDKSAKFLETVFATITKLKINRAETFVVMEGAAQFQDQENQTSKVASCDVFQFSDGRLVEITSYVIELNKRSVDR